MIDLRELGFTAACVLSLGAGACYDPVIENGGLACPRGECPSGFECRDGHCWMSGTGGGGGGGAGGAACVPMAMPGSTCDPVCQTGCSTGRCLGQGASATCVPNGTKKLGEPCSTDDCEAGLVCLGADCGAFCARYCRDDSQCPATSRCQIAIATPDRKDTGFTACDVRSNGCNPVGLAAATKSCASEGIGFGCYVLWSDEPDKTGCACAWHTPPLAEGAACTELRDCQPGLLCALRVCRRVCKLGGSDPTCAGKTCTPFMRSKVYGVCQ